MNVTRRGMCQFTLATLVMGRRWLSSSQAFAAEDLKVSDNAPEVKFDFETKGVDGWSSVDGQWTVEEMAGASSGKKVVVHCATWNEFNVNVAADCYFTDVDVPRRFK